MVNDRKKNLSPIEFAEHLKKNGYSGGDIHLGACSTGQGDNCFAQRLSKILGVRVKAPDDDVYYASEEGALFVGSPVRNIGAWRGFNKGVEE